MKMRKAMSVLLLTLGLIALMGGNASLIASPSVSHATHFFSEKGPLLPHNEDGCYVCHANGHEQCVGQPLFADLLPLSATHVCDNCHSPDGAFPGGDPLTSLLDPTIGAKANWDEGVYDSGGEMLKAGKEKWCITCHDDVPANSDWEGSGINAPDVSPYYTSGHGRPDADVECLVCHDATFTHIDGEPRTYAFNDEDVYPADFIVDMYAYANSGVAYASGYRLRYVDGQVPMMIPASWDGTFDPYNDDARIKNTSFRRCFVSGCHDSRKIFGSQTNFNNDGYNIHDFHLIRTVSWDSDWDTNTQVSPNGVDSFMTCPSCHNVHGAAPTEAGWTNEPMIRDGSLIGRTGFGFSYVIDDSPAGWVTSEGATQSNSVGAIFRNGTGGICVGCHGAYGDPPDTRYYAASTITLFTGVHIGPDSSTTLQVAGTPWTPGELVDKEIHNITDDSYDTIEANTENTATGSGLFAGTDDTWQAGDEAEIYEYSHVYYMQWFRDYQDCSSTVDMIWTYDTHGGKDYSSLSTWEEDTDIDITPANDVVVLSHSGLMGSIVSGDTVTGADSGATGIVVGVVTGTQICIDVTSSDFEEGEQIYQTVDVNYVVSISPAKHVGVIYLDCYDGPHNDYVVLAKGDEILPTTPTTDVAHYRCIRSAADCATPFAGKRQTGAYFEAYFESTEDAPVFKVTEDFSRLQHIGAKLTYNSTTVRRVFNLVGDYTKVIGCIAYDSTNNGSARVHGFSLSGNRAAAINCIAHDIEGKGFLLAAAEYLYFALAYNCTAVDCGQYGFSNNSSTYNIVCNSVGYNNTGGDFQSGFATYHSDYNMSSDGSAPGTNSKTNKDFTNMWVSETPGSEDYHLSETGVADADFQAGVYPLPAGLNPPDYYLTDDIDGEPRLIWYRGADEFGPPGNNYQSIHTVSGSVGPLDGVSMSGLPGNPVTSGGGSYTAIVPNDWSGTVTPAKLGYTFDPPSRVYSNVTSDQTNEDYIPIGTFYTISGHVGSVDGVRLSGLPGIDEWTPPVTSDGGFYSSTVGHGWSGTVYPVDYSGTYRFEPSNRVYTNVTSDQTNQDYTPIVIHTVSGWVQDSLGAGVAGVTMSGLPGSPVSTSQGSYSGTVDDGWSGTVTPTKDGCTFEPASRQYDNVTQTLWQQNYTATCGP